MSGTPIFDSVRREFIDVANAGFSQGRIAERQEIVALVKAIPRPGQQIKTLLKKLEETL